jgi:putative ABC transport system permease protein
VTGVIDDLVRVVRQSQTVRRSLFAYTAMAFIDGRLRSIGSIAAAQLWYHRRRVVLAVVGIAVAVLLITLIVGLGGGVTERGQAALEGINRDLWMSANVEFAPTAIGGVDNELVDAHEVARGIQSRSEVQNAQAVSFQSVYTSPGSTGSDPPGADAFTSVVGTGVTGTSAPIPLTNGTGFTRSDVHYANGTYGGPKTNAVIVDQRAADLLGVSVGDTLYVGGTIGNAQKHALRVVGISEGISSFVGAPTVILHLSELQSLTGTTGADSASVITITLKDGVDHRGAAAAIERDYPDHEVRTNSEQLSRILEGQTPVIVGTVAIVVLAVVVGLALVINVSALLVYGQRSELAALKAAGVSTPLLVGTVGAQGVMIGLVGGGLGLAGTPLAARAVNDAVNRLTGIESLIAIRFVFLAFGAVVAVVMGVAGAAVAGYLIARISPLEQLD